MVLIKRVLMMSLITAALAMPGGAEVMEPLTFKVGEGFPTLTVIFVEDALHVMDGTKTMQRIPCDEDVVRAVEEMSMELVSLVDMNFDGFLDLQIPESLGSINAYYACYLWNPEKSLFEKNEALEEIASPQFQEDTKEIFSFCHGTATDNVEALYTWRNGTLTLLWRKTQSYAEDSGRFVITEESLKGDGTLRIDLERSFSEEELDRYLQGDSGVNEKTHSLMKAASEAILGTTISGEPRYHGEYVSPEGKHITAWLVDLENGEIICFEVSDGDTALYLNKGGDNGTFLINFGKGITLGERLEE